MKLHILLAAILVAILSSPAGGADLTVRYKVALKSGSLMRPETAKKMEEAQKTAPTELVTRFHGDMARSEANGRVTLIDYGRQQVTLLDSKGQRFATAPFDEYLATLRHAAKPMPAQLAAALRKAQPHAVSRDNFVLASIDGIRAEQTAVKIDYSLPAALGMGDIVAMRIETRFWRPLEEEMTRLPLLKEWAGWLARGNGLAQPASTLDNVFAAGAGEEMRGAIEALEKNADRPALKVQVAYSMPGLAALARKRGVDAPAGADPTGTILEISLELVDLSPALLADDMFTVPAGFRSVSMKDITTPTLVPVSQLPGFTPPMLISRTAPVYTPEARKAKIEGTVEIAIVVGVDGNVLRPQIIKSLSPDLDRKAIEAVSQFKFRPAERDGKPVEVAATIQINFRLPDKPPANAP